MKNHIPDRRWNSKTVWRRSGSENTTFLWDHPDRGEEQGNFLGESDGSRPPLRDSLPDDGEARNDFSAISGNYTYRPHVEPRVKLYVPREESCPIPLKHIDVTRNTFSSLDVLLEKSIDDYWNVDGDRDLSDTWTSFTRFPILDEKPPDGYTWSGGRLTRKQTTFPTPLRYIDVARNCEQYIHKYSTYRVAQHDHISSRKHAWLERWKAQDCTSLCPRKNCHRRAMSHSLPHLTLSKSTSSLSPTSSTSPIFPTVSPTHTRSLVHDPHSATFHGRVAAQHKSHLSQDMSPNHRDRSDRA